MVTEYRMFAGIDYTAGTRVTFQGKSYPVQYVGAGLDSSAIVIAILCKIGEYTLYDLYTDTPAKDGVTAEDIQMMAKNAIFLNRQRSRRQE